MAKTTDALKILQRVTGDNERRQAGIAEARLYFEVAQMIYDARTRARLSQSELAKLIGRKPSVIERLEDGDYERLSLRMLQRIAAALGQRLVVRLVPRKATLS
jgi:ribosome-binding protein aMBF1 (putative translation factor)